MFKEMAFISYYFHWPEHEVLSLDHATRRRWCREISSINASITPSDDSHREKSILDMKPVSFNF